MFERIKLDNGVRVVWEKIPHVRSVSVGIWVGVGSRNETKENNGISHFIEHMLFKGTKKRSAKQIAAAIDNIGGKINAFTGKECTCFYTKTLDTHIDIAMDILADMFFNSKFSAKNIEIEKKVILEEIGMYEDSPEELVHDVFYKTVWNGNSLSYPILGTKESLININRDKVIDYMTKNYIPKNVVIAAAGNLDSTKFLDTVKKYFDNWNPECNTDFEYENAEFITDVKIKEKDTEQVHMCLGCNGIEQGSNELYSLLAINNILGGGMSSRLFQKIREKKGLVYSIYSYPSAYKDTGLFTVYAGMNPIHIGTVIELIIDEIRLLLNKGINKEELRKSKEQLKGNYILGLESTSSRMNSIGKSELLLNRINTTEEVLNLIDSINMESVEAVVKKVFKIDHISFSAVGNIKESEIITKALGSVI
jgi:predicted Zn-dependent peptidase